MANNILAATVTLPTTSPLFLHPSDQPGTTLVSDTLTGDNYHKWAKATRRALKAKNKLGFVDGTIPKPGTTDPNLKPWESCNSMVASWIYNSLEKSIQDSVNDSDDAKGMWDELRQRFSQKNIPRIHQIKTELSVLRQEGCTVTAYFTKLKALWEELADYSAVPECTCAASAAYTAEKEAERIHQFLMGLDHETYGAIRSQILSLDVLPNMNKVYALIIQQERQRSINRGRETKEEASTMAFYATNGGGRDRSWTEQRYKPQCEHCGKPGHEKAHCWELIGYPTNWEPRRNQTGRKNSSANNSGGVRSSNGSSSNNGTRGFNNSGTGASRLRQPADGRQPTGGHASHVRVADNGQMAQGTRTLTDTEYEQFLSLIG